MLVAAGEGVVDEVQASSAFEELYREGYGPMVRLAYLLTGDRAVAEELVQEASQCTARGSGPRRRRPTRGRRW